MGKDKFENEDLIAYGLPEDVWFHVEGESSAHVYLRLKEDEDWKDIPDIIIEEACQLVKANSIAGKKKANISIIWTPWSNLNKTNDMEVGAIGFHDNNNVKKKRIEKDNSIVNKLNKTKKESHPDLKALQDARKKQTQLKNKAIKKAFIQAEKEEKERKKEEKKLLSYESIFEAADSGHVMQSNSDISGTDNADAAEEFEDDFM